MASTSSLGLKRSDSIADTMPDALKQSRFHMKKCFARYTFCKTKFYSKLNKEKVI